MERWLLGGLGILLLLIGCANPAPNMAEKDQEVADVAELKRLVLLPITLSISPKDPTQCQGPCNPERDRSEIALAASTFVHSARDYEIVCLDYACPRIPDSVISDAELTTWAASISRWIEENPGKTQLPADLVSILHQIEEAYDVEGILLINGKLRYVQYADIAHWILTLTFSSYYNLFRGHTADLQAHVFAAANGSKLWAGEAVVTQIGQEQVTPTTPAISRYGPRLFEELPKSRAEDACNNC